MFYEEGEEELAIKQRMLQELHSRRTKNELGNILHEALLKLRNENEQAE